MNTCLRTGNTCFVNAAMQCLRHTPGLPLMLLPDLLTAARPESAPPTPRSQAPNLGLSISRHGSQQDPMCAAPVVEKQALMSINAISALVSWLWVVLNL